MARTDLLFGFGCRLTERLDEGQVLVGGELEDAKQRLIFICQAVKRWCG